MSENLIFAGAIGAFLFWAYTRIDAANQERIRVSQALDEARQQLKQLHDQHNLRRRSDLEALRDYVVGLEKNWETSGAPAETELLDVLTIWIRERLAGRI